MSDNDLINEKNFNSVKNIVAAIIAVISLCFGIMSFVYKTFPTKEDMKGDIHEVEQRLIAKPDFWKKVKELEDSIERLEKKNEYLRKEAKEDATKLRAEFRTEKILDIAMRLKIVDETLLKDPNNNTLLNYRAYLCKEYERIQGKLDNSMKELEK